MSKPSFRIVAKDTAATIWLYDEIGYWGITAKTFAEELKAIGDVEAITVQINSPGGDVFDGLAIYNSLVKHRASVNVEIDGYAASIASIIAMAGDSISIADNAMLMIHNPWTFAMGEANDLRKTADTLDQVRTQLINTYAKRTGLDDETIGEMMDAETWIESGPAVEQGFADAVMESQRLAASSMKREFHRKPPQNIEKVETPPDLPKWKRAQAQLRSRIAGAELNGRRDERGKPIPTDDGTGLQVERV